MKPEKSMVDSLRNLQCRIANRLGLDYCMCCGRWHRKSRMDRAVDSREGLEGLCHKCGTFIWVDRITQKSGLKRVIRKGPHG